MIEKVISITLPIACLFSYGIYIYIGLSVQFKCRMCFEFKQKSKTAQFGHHTFRIHNEDAYML